MSYAVIFKTVTSSELACSGLTAVMVADCCFSSSSVGSLALSTLMPSEFRRTILDKTQFRYFGRRIKKVVNMDDVTGLKLVRGRKRCLTVSEIATYRRDADATSDETGRTDLLVRI